MLIFKSSKAIDKFYLQHINSVVADFTELDKLWLANNKWDMLQSDILKVCIQICCCTVPSNWDKKIPHAFQQRLSDEKTLTLCRAIPAYKTLARLWESHQDQHPVEQPGISQRARKTWEQAGNLNPADEQAGINPRWCGYVQVQSLYMEWGGYIQNEVATGPCTATPETQHFVQKGLDKLNEYNNCMNMVPTYVLALSMSFVD